MRIALSRLKVEKDLSVLLKLKIFQAAASNPFEVRKLGIKTFFKISLWTEFSFTTLRLLMPPLFIIK